jgi:DNA-binding MurR/RpiR family transcriptional regulator
MLRLRVVLLDPAGGLALEMAATMTRRDVLVAIAFRHYAKEVVSISDLAGKIAVPLIAITDGQLSPLAKNARIVFSIPEHEYTFSRTLAAPMCLVQSIAMAIAAAQPENATPRIPTVTEIQKTRGDR